MARTVGNGLRIPASAAAGFVFTSDGSGNGTWANPAKTFWITHNWVVGGEIKVASGQTDLIPHMFVAVAPNQTLKIAKVRYNIEAGTSVTFKIQKNDVDVTGLTSLSATTTITTTDPADVALADGDTLSVVVTAVSATPQNLTVGLTLEYTI